MSAPTATSVDAIVHQSCFKWNLTPQNQLYKKKKKCTKLIDVYNAGEEKTVFIHVQISYIQNKSLWLIRVTLQSLCKNASFFFYNKSDFSYKLLSRCQHSFPVQMCVKWEEAPRVCSPRVSPVRETDTRPRPTLSRNGGDEGPASSLHNIEFGSGTASINSEAAPFSARKFVVIPVFPPRPLASDVLVSALRFTPKPAAIQARISEPRVPERYRRQTAGSFCNYKCLEKKTKYHSLNC